MHSRVVSERPPILQRVRGDAAVAVGPDGALKELRQSGSAKAFVHGLARGAPEVVFLNTAGGLTGGDRLSFRVRVLDGASLTAATQTAERAYASEAGEARLDIACFVGAGARLDWLPQETILYDGAALARRTQIELAGDACLLAVEIVVLGRIAMGERVRRLDFRDRRTILRSGRPVLIDPLALDGPVLERRAKPLVDDMRAFASLAFVGAGAEDAAGALRRLPDVDGVEMGVSGWDGRLTARLLAPDLLPLKRRLAPMLSALRGGRPLPRVWVSGGV